MTGERRQGVDVDFSLAGFRCSAHVKGVIVRSGNVFPKDRRAFFCVDVEEKKKTLLGSSLRISAKLGVVQLVAALAVVYDREEAGADVELHVGHLLSHQLPLEGTERNQGRGHFLRVNQQLPGMVDNVSNLS